jgi:hypothetical protein
MVDPTSALCEDVTKEEAPRCTVCGEPILGEASHRVVTRIEDDAVVTEHFCGPECLAERDG